MAQLLQALLDKHPTKTIYVAWDNRNTHEDDEVEAVIRGAASPLALLYLPNYGPWLNSIGDALAAFPPQDNPLRTFCFRCP